MFQTDQTFLHSSTSSPSSSSIILCLVCSESADGTHYGVQACRACTAFFRRTIQLQRNYNCSKNDECFINSNIRNMCRACRFAKCLNMGMKKTSVQEKRDRIGKRLRSSQDLLQRGEPILDNLYQAYKELEDVRKKVYSIAKDKPPRAISFAELQAIYLKDMRNVYRFLCKAFPRYSNFSPELKKIQFKNFFLPFILLESSYFAYINNKQDIWIIPSGDYIDIQNLQSYYCDNSNQSIRKETIEMFRAQFDNLKSSITKPLVNESVDVFEFLSLVSMLLWETDVDTTLSKFSYHDQTLKMRKILVEDLLFYYKSCKIYEDPALRLGKIMIILPSIQRSTQHFHKYLELKHFLNFYALPYHLFDMFTPVS